MENGIEVVDRLPSVEESYGRGALGKQPQKARFANRKSRYQAALARAVTPQDMADVWAEIVRCGKGGCDVDTPSKIAAWKMLADHTVGRPKQAEVEHRHVNISAQFFGDNAPRVT